MPNLPFVTVDVFTTTAFHGNPLAVITDASALDAAAMQHVACEFGYSETVFVLPPEAPGHTAKLRIFTPTTEVPFAGHPNVGAAVVLGRQGEVFGRRIGDLLVFEEQAGLVEVALIRDAGEVTGATIRAPGPLTIGAAVDEALLAGCLSLDVADIVTVRHPPRFLSVGLKFVIAELRDLDALGRITVRREQFEAGVARYPHEQSDFSTFVYVRDPQDPWRIRARMFAPLDNVAEDPATGSASAALGAFLVQREEPDDCARGMAITQGVEMGRESRIALEIRKVAGEVTDVRISGGAVEIMRGTIRC